MAVLKHFIFALGIFFGLTGCHFNYLIKSGYYQAKILSRQEEVSAVLAKPNTKPEVKRKLELAQDVIHFMEKDLGLNTHSNYRNYVQLDDKYVTYALTAAEKFKLQPYLWAFPLVGSVPYKGFFVKADADREATELAGLGYDTTVRGVSAYSSLGWLRDPILSSMLNYRDEDFVNLLIHESIHANIYIKSQADFNEQLATFLGNKGSELYFQSNESLKASAADYLKNSAHDEKLFSDFLSAEIKSLEDFYATPANLSEDKKTARLQDIQMRFKHVVLPKMKTGNHSRFGEEPLNNATLISYKTYFMDLSDFESIYQKFKGDFREFFAHCKKIESSDNPQTQFRLGP